MVSRVLTSIVLIVGMAMSALSVPLPKSAAGANGFVEVIAFDVPGDPVGFRLPLLQFTTKLLRSVESVYALEMPRGDVGLLIHAQNGTTNDARVITKSTRRDGAAITHVYLPSPGYSDINALRHAIVKGYLRAWIDRNRPPTAAAIPPPDWLVIGTLRSLDSEVVKDDKRAILKLWSQAALPSFSAICRDPLGTVPTHSAAGYLVSWMREERVYRQMLETLARGQSLIAATLASALTGEKEPHLQDRANDERLARLTRAVLSPGRASEWDLNVFTSRLLLFSPKFDKNIRSNDAYCTFREAIGLADENPELRAIAAAKAREMLFAAIGRGDRLSAVAESYRVFLAALANGDSPQKLTQLLDDAETQLQEILNENRKDDNG